jgi:arylformamidase
VSAPVFLHYARAALDREYNNRGKVPDFADHLSRYAAESERTRRELPGRLDLRYGPAPGETLDVFLPPDARPRPAPVQVFVHGGYWMALDKSDFSFVARAFHPAGAVVVVINYALIPAVDMDELVRQCRAAVAWIHRNIGAFGGDPGRIFVYLNDTLRLTPEVARRNSPVHLAPVRSGPLLLPVGALEGPEYHRQSEDLAAAWRQRGLTARVLDLAGQDHFSIVAQLGDPRSDVAGAIRGQMGLGH